MAEQSFDKLNILKRRSLPYEQYFGEMKLTEKQKKNRKKTALIIEDYIMIFFDALLANMDLGQLNKVALTQELTYMIYDVVEEEKFFGDDEQQVEKYVENLVEEIYESTVENLESSPDDYDYTGENPYWVSEDRAQFVAENESNTLWGSKEFIEAKENGKTHKIWMAYPDDRVRLTHQEVNGAKIPIDSYFDVGRARMLYPKDVTSELSTGAECPEEVINCRCSAVYV